jgi:prepilin-type N-terminal cleavage/methylation domain-containing protein
MPAARARRAEGGFTMIEILVALLVSVIGLSGVLIAQANSVKSTRIVRQLGRASVLAEEVMEISRGMSVATLQNGVTFPAQSDGTPGGGTTYFITLSAVDLPASTNLVRVTSEVRFTPNNEPNSAELRRVRVEMVRTKTETL